MATLYASDGGVPWSNNTPIYKPLGKGEVAVAKGTYNFLVNPTAADVIRFCKIPRGTEVIGGWIAGADLDTGTEALDIDFGWEANGTEIADPDGFGNMGILDGDTVSQIIPVAGIWRPLQGVLLTGAPVTFTNETWLSATVNAPANATGTGKLTFVALYRCF